MARNKFVFVVEGDVFMTWSYDETYPEAERWTAGLNSNPTIIDVSSHQQINEVGIGWTWDGTNFSPPPSQS